MSKNKFKITKKILAKEENQVDSRLYEIISKNIQIRMLGADRNDLFKMLLQLQSQLYQLKQQLAEKDKEINSLIVDYEKRISQEQELMSNMEHRLVEKDNLIEYGKEEIRKRNKRIDEIVERDKKLFAEKDKEIEEKMMSFEKRCQEYYKSDEFKRDFAIQELEKVKNFVDGRTYCANYIKKRIKELKGEKDVED